MSYASSNNGPYGLLIPMAWLILSSLLMSFIGGLVYFYFFFEGQFENEEETKYQVFRQDDPD